MSNYICQHTIGSIIKATFKICKSHFPTLFLVVMLPSIPLLFIQSVLANSGQDILALLVTILFIPVFTLIWAAMTMAVSNICLGNKPGFIVSYRYILSPVVGKLLATNLLQVLVVYIGIVLLIVPGLIFAVWLIFIPTIVIMENTWGLSALKRSRNLVKGNFWRLSLLFIVMMFIAGAIGGLLGAIYGLLSYFVPGIIGGNIVLLFLIAVIQVTGNILGSITLILFYYDLRVRKEAYDITVLSENISM